MISNFDTCFIPGNSVDYLPRKLIRTKKRSPADCKYIFLSFEGVPTYLPTYLAGLAQKMAWYKKFMATALEDIPHIYLQQTDDCSRLGEVLKIRFSAKTCLHWKNALNISAFKRMNCIFLNGSSRASFLLYFQSFQTNNTIFTIYQCENCPFSILRPDSNPQPLDNESSPITTT